jgi:hypothetical protein
MFAAAKWFVDKHLIKNSADGTFVPKGALLVSATMRPLCDVVGSRER